MNYTFINNLLTILVAVITLITAIQKEHAFYKNNTQSTDSKDTSMKRKGNTRASATDMPPRMQLKIQEDASNNLTSVEQNKLLLRLVQSTNTQVETLSNSMTILQQNVMSSNSRLDHIDSQLNELNHRVTTLENYSLQKEEKQ